MQRCRQCGRGNLDAADVCAACNRALAGEALHSSPYALSSVAASRSYSLVKPLLIGRDPGSDIVLPSPQISRKHAQLVPTDGQMLLSDLGSSNGTFVNGARVTHPTPLKDGDVVELGGMTRLYFDGKQLVRFDEAGHARLDAVDLCYDVRASDGTLRLLNDITLQIKPREFVAIVGGSGAGKSTLLKALCGFQRATDGSVYLNGADLYRHRAALSSSIGYVPQDDIIHRELTVHEALLYAARLRLPADVTAQEREQRISAVLQTLELTQRRDTLVAQLSGGQRKRVSIGVELLSEPSLLFLDEPTSGLDPGLERHMMQVLRRLADEGKTVVLVTHATQNIELCDGLIFLARGGHLAFYGKPHEALAHFHTDDFAEIYEKVGSSTKAPEQWAQEYRQSPAHADYVEGRLRPLRTLLKASNANGTAATAPETNPLRVPLTTQLTALVSRYLKVTVRDRRNFAILLAQAPLIGLLLALVLPGDLFSAEKVIAAGTLNTERLSNPKTFAFLLTIAMVWLGATNAAREIVKERAIYQRERMVSLRIAPYLASKGLVLVGLCCLQTLLLLFFVSVKIRLDHPGFEGYGALFLVLALIGVSSTALGLLVSALVSSSDQAGSLIPVILLPQIFLCGALLPLQGSLEIASQATICRWGYVGAGRAIGLMPFYDESIGEEQKRSDKEKEQAGSKAAQPTGVAEQILRQQARQQAAESIEAESRARISSINGFRSGVKTVGAGKPTEACSILSAFTVLLLSTTHVALSATERKRL